MLCKSIIAKDNFPGSSSVNGALLNDLQNNVFVCTKDRLHSYLKEVNVSKCFALSQEKVHFNVLLLQVYVC